MHAEEEEKQPQRAEIHTYESQSLVYAMNWSVSARAAMRACALLPAVGLIVSRSACASRLLCWAQVRRDKRFRLAVGSFREELNNNYVEIISRELAGPCTMHRTGKLCAEAALPSSAHGSQHSMGAAAACYSRNTVPQRPRGDGRSLSSCSRARV